MQIYMNLWGKMLLGTFSLSKYFKDRYDYIKYFWDIHKRSGKGGG